MTKQEHDLMFSLFGVQMQVCVMILEILQSREIAELGDVGPFVALAMARMREYMPVYFQTYVSTARSAQVELPEGFSPPA